MKLQRGFTLIEILVVLAIIAILAAMAMPSFDPRIVREQVAESVELMEDYKKLVAFYHKSTLVFLKNNKEAGIPEPEKLIGNYVDNIELKDGVFHLHFANKAHPSLKGKYLSIRPVVVKDSPQSPISWVCGNSTVPEGMSAVGENKTDIEAKYLPFECRI
jgi:type IV pilus assembly protein PilA